MESKCGYIVPTLGTRDSMLLDCLKSIRQNDVGYILLVKPRDVLITNREILKLVNGVHDEPHEGIASAINFAVSKLPEGIRYFGWLGDDDLLYPDSVRLCLSTFEVDKKAALVYGYCDYIDPLGNVLIKNKVGGYAKYLVRFGPCLIPQPGSLISVDSFKSLGGLDQSLKFAFDLDLYIRFQLNGMAINHAAGNLAKFRWHGDSLTAGQRTGSIREAALVRKRHAKTWMRVVLFMFEPVIYLLSLLSGLILNMKSKTS